MNLAEQVRQGGPGVFQSPRGYVVEVAEDGMVRSFGPGQALNVEQYRASYRRMIAIESEKIMKKAWDKLRVPPPTPKQHLLRPGSFRLVTGSAGIRLREIKNNEAQLQIGTDEPDWQNFGAAALTEFIEFLTELREQLKE